MRKKRCAEQHSSAATLPRGVTRRNITEEGEVEWEYLAPDGDPIEEEDRIQRWNSMGLPPAGRRLDLPESTPHSGDGSRREGRLRTVTTPTGRRSQRR